MEDEEKSPLDQQQPVRVQEIRRQWAVHEDGALAYRLQNEEITQHYSGNRTRNAIVREDTPKAREEQRKEEQEALEHRFQHLHLLQQQAEEDARLAKELANRFEMGMEGASLQQAGSSVGAAANSSSSLATKPDEEFDFHSTSIEKRQPSECAFPITGALSHSPVETFNHLDNQYSGASGPVVKRPQKTENSTSPPLNNGEKKVVKSIMKPSSRKEMFTPLFKSQPSSEGAACSSSCLSSSNQGITLDPELQNLEMELPPLEEVQKAEQKLLQEKLDEEMALKLQKEFEQMEIDKRVAVEAQDRELAKMIHQKEKERLRRAKERAKLKAAAAALEANPTEGIEISPGPSHSPLSQRSGSVEIGPSPPRIPEKSHSRLDRDDPIRFRAESKPLPPLHCPVESQSPSRRISSSSRSNSSTHSITLQDNFVPPYMPQTGVATGFQNIQKKKK